MKSSPHIGFSIVFITIGCISQINLFSQSIQAEVIASAGDCFNFEDKQVSWTLGETVIDFYQANAFMISQGFHQPSFLFIEIPEQDEPGFKVSIFPNPASQLVRVKISGSGNNDRFRAVIYDATGKIWFSEDLDNAKESEIDLRQLNDGIFILNVISLTDGIKQGYKIIKIR